MSARRKLLLLGSLYLAQGLPFGFFTQALPALMRKQGLSLPEVGLANLLALPWAAKFLWAPLVDRHGSERFGRRKSFIVPLQLAAVLALVLLAAVDPAQGLSPLMVGVFVVNLLAASQDIATDALATELLSEGERGLGNGIQVAGYRVGMILGGGALLVVFDRLGWTRSFLLMAVVLALSTLPALLFREPPAPRAPEAGQGERLGTWLRRPGLAGWLGLLLVFKTGEALAGGMLRPFLVDRGLTLEDLGYLLGSVGFVAGMLGALLGGALVTRLGRRPALVGFGLLQSAAVAAYGAVALGAGKPWLYAIVALEHLASGMATAALFTAMMDVCRPGHAASDYTLQASAVVIATGAGAALSGFVAARLGYAGHFALCALLSALGALYAWAYRPGGEFRFVRAGGTPCGPSSTPEPSTP